MSARTNANSADSDWESYAGQGLERVRPEDLEFTAEAIAAAKARVPLDQIIGEDLPLKPAGSVWVGLCPFHDERTPSFTVYADNYHCFGCGAHGDAIHWLQFARQMSFDEAVIYLFGADPRPGTLLPHQDDAASQATAQRIWAETFTARNTPVETYLRSRGLAIPPGESVIRYHPRCWCGNEQRPAMVALMSDPVTGAPRGIHRTFLKSDGSGKADIAKPKMMLGQGGVIQLYPLKGNGLSIAEGIQTALAVAQGFGSGPVWACGSAGNIRKFPILPRITLRIFADNDDAGLAAARDCARRWIDNGQQPLIYIPPAGDDWADAARRVAP
jgi:DNA primase